MARLIASNGVEKSGGHSMVSLVGLRGWTLLLLTLALAACAATPQRRAAEAEELIRAGKVEEATELLEASQRSLPEDAGLQVALCSAYFAGAQRAFEAGNEDQYVSLLERAQQQCLRALELDSKRADAHNMLGILAAYRGDMKASRESFELARQLDPLNPVYPVNLAELYVYLGRKPLVQARLARGRKLRGSPAQIELVEVLDAWKSGDYVGARDTFEDIVLLDPEQVRTWNGASSIETFEDFTAHCCRLPLCGPYMRGACTAMKQQVTEREVTAETVRRELVMEMERARRVREIYRDRRDVEITTEPAPTGTETDRPSPERPSPDQEGDGTGEKRAPTP
jgi:tetratricopeptide (TPR) repeat protein